MNKITLRNNVECTGMENMRSQFITICEQNAVDIDKTCIKQNKEDRDCGVMVGYKDNNVVAVAPWHRFIKEEDGKRYYKLLTSPSSKQFDHLLESLG